jgi:hypothetical protein
MKKPLILLTALTLFSCGSIKKNKEHLEITTESDSTATSSTETTESSSTLEIKDWLSESYSFTPFNPEKPFFVNGKEYKNVIVERIKEVDKSTTETFWEKKSLELEEIILKQQQQLEQFNKEKQTDNLYFYLLIFLVIALIIILIYRKL